MKNGLAIKSGLLTAFCLSFVLCFPMTTNGQQDKRIAAAKKRVEQYVKRQRTTSENRLAAVIEDMDRICDLKDSQLKKLRFAAKGAVSKYTGKIEKQQNDMYRRQFGEAWDKEEGDEAADKEKPKQNVVAGNALIERAVLVDNFAFASSRNSAFPVENEKIWKDNFSKILDSEQTKKYGAALMKRAAFQRNAAVNTFVVRIDKQLLLTPKQREAILKVIDEKFGDKIAARGNQMGIVAFNRGRNNDDAPPIKYELLGGLSENQLKIWKSSFEPQLRNMKNMVFQGGAMNWQVDGAQIQIQGNFAAPVQVIRNVAPLVEKKPKDNDEKDKKNKAKKAEKADK